MAFFGLFGGSDAPKPPAPESPPAIKNPKPCCVCTDEKAARDKCMLMSSSDNPVEECGELVAKYKACMAGYGFTI